MALVLGIDGGGSRTTAAVASGSSVLALATGGPSNLRTHGPDRAIALIDSVVVDVLTQANTDRSAIEAIAVGLAGVSRRTEREPVEAWLARSFGGRPSSLVTDVELVLAAGAKAAVGVAVVSGTGSIVLGRTADGRAARSGGLGPIVGDPGSGYAIGRSALLATADAVNGVGSCGAMSELVLARIGAASPEEISAGGRPREVAALTPLVSEAAENGDAVAIGILETAGCQLARQVTSVLRRLHWAGGIQLVLAGGVLVHVGAVRQALLRELEVARWILHTPIVVERPVLGAVALAEELLEPVATVR